MATGIRINYIRIPVVCFWMHIGVFCPCVLTVAVAIKFMLTYHRKNHIIYSSFASSEVKGVKEVITPYGRSGN